MSAPSVESASRVIERLEDAYAAHPNGLLAFDADGTLWTGDVGIDLFRTAVSRGALRAEALPALRAEAETYGVVTSRDPNEQGLLLFEAYVADRYPEGRAFAMMAWAFAGHSAQGLDALADDMLRAGGIEQRLQHEVVPILDWAKDAGISAFVVSASPVAVVHAAARRLGFFAALRILAMTPVLRDGVVAPEVAPPITYRAGKLEALALAAPGRPLVGAFGDSAFDLEMLGRAEVAVAVRPKPELLANASAVPRLVTLER